MNTKLRHLITAIGTACLANFLAGVQPAMAQNQPYIGIYGTVQGGQLVFEYPHYGAVQVDAVSPDYPSPTDVTQEAQAQSPIVYSGYALDGYYLDTVALRATNHLRLQAVAPKYLYYPYYDTFGDFHEARFEGATMAYIPYHPDYITIYGPFAANTSIPVIIRARYQGIIRAGPGNQGDGGKMWHDYGRVSQPVPPPDVDINAYTYATFSSVSGGQSEYWATVPGASQNIDVAREYPFTAVSAIAGQTPPFPYPGGQVVVYCKNGASADVTVSFEIVVPRGYSASSQLGTAMRVVFSNAQPNFTDTGDITVPNSVPAVVPNWATDINPGAVDEADQALEFLFTANSNPYLFAVGPAISPDGTMTFTPTPGMVGSAQVTVVLHDNGGTALGGIDTSLPHTFTINVNGVDAPPTDTTVTAESPYEVLVKWSEPVAAPSASTAGNYSLGGRLSVTSATLLDPITVRLGTSRQEESTSYPLHIAGVQDTSGNPTLLDTSFRSLRYQSGQVHLRTWPDDAGVFNAFGTEQIAYRPPVRDETLTSYFSGEGLGDVYFGQLRGWFTPDVTDNYVFFCASDDDSELYLSTDDNPANKLRIAAVPGWTNAREWNKYPEQQSGSVSLQAGQRYYLELVWREGIFGDHGAVAVKRASEVDPANNSGELSGNRLGNYVAPDLASFNFPGFSSSSGMGIFNDATVANGILTLTSAAAQNGSAVFSSRLSLQPGFDSTFTFRITDPGGALDASGNPGGDGLALVIQGQGPTYTGPRVGYIPYSIPNAIAVEFDTWNNGNLLDPDGNHVSIQDVGPTPNGYDEFFHSRSLGFGSPAFNLSDGQVHTAHIRYRPGSLQVFLDNAATPIASADIELDNIGGRTALTEDGAGWLGLVAGTGAACESHEILSWSFDSYVPTPNHLPVANAGGPYTINQGSALTLDGSGSQDPDTATGDIIVSYSWDLNSDGTFDFTSVSPSVTLTPSQLTPLGLGVGSRTISLRVTGSHSATSTASTTLTIRGTQTITFGPIANHTYGDAPFAINASVSSGLPVSFTSLTPSVVTVSGNTVTIVGPGAATIRASQSGDVNYLPAADVEQTFTVSQAPPTLSNPIADFAVNEDSPDTVIDLRAVFADFETADADLVYSLQANSNSGLVPAMVDNAADTLTLPYTANQFGTATLTVRATDAGGLFIEDTFVQTVNQVSDNDPGDLDSDFNPSANGEMYGLALQPDAKILMAGNFTSVGGMARPYVARLNADGTLDTGFSADPNSQVHGLMVQPDGKVILRGAFTAVGSAVRKGIARVNANGTLDPDFNPDANGPVQSMALQSDGKLVIGGSFTALGSVPRNRIARFNAIGTLDLSFNPEANNEVLSMAVQPDGKVVIVGRFTTVNGNTRPYIALLTSDGTLDAGFNPNANSLVLCVAIQADGKLVIGGFFDRIDGARRYGLARLNADGTLDPSFAPSLTSTPTSIAVLADGRVMISGYFTMVNGAVRNGIARLNSDGTLDVGFAAAVDGGVHGLAVQADGTILLAGQFTQVGGQARRGIARLENDTANQQLAVHGANRVEWLRGGASQEVQEAMFEVSTDGGSTWTSLGVGTRIAGGWEKTGLSLSGEGRVRARARVASGYYNGSSGLVGAVSSFFFNTAPIVANAIASQSATYGISFSFTVPANTFSDADAGQTLSYTASALPTWLSFDANTRTFSGTPTGIDSSTITVTATDSALPPLSASTTFTLNVSPAPQTLSFASIPGHSYGDASFTINATASSSLPVSFTSLTPAVATVSGNMVTIVGAGTATIRASQSGDANYLPAADVQQTLTISKANQTITFNPPATSTYGADQTLDGVASSGLVVSYTVSGPATLNGSVIHFTGLGTVTVTAAQGGNANCNSASSVIRSISVGKAPLTVIAENKTKVYGQANPALTFTYSGFVNGDTAAVLRGSPKLSTTATTSSLVGGYSIAVSPGNLSAVNYTFAVANGLMSVAAANTTVSAANVTGKFGAVSVTLSAAVSAVSPSTAAVNEGTVNFTVRNSSGVMIGQSVTGTVSKGTANASFPTGTLAKGAYAISVSYTDTIVTPNFNNRVGTSTGTLTIK